MGEWRQVQPAAEPAATHTKPLRTAEGSEETRSEKA